MNLTLYQLNHKYIPLRLSIILNINRTPAIKTPVLLRNTSETTKFVWSVNF